MVMRRPWGYPQYDRAQRHQRHHRGHQRHHPEGSNDVRAGIATGIVSPTQVTSISVGWTFTPNPSVDEMEPTYGRFDTHTFSGSTKK